MLNAVVMLLFAILPAGLGIIARSRFPVLPNRELALPSVLMNLLPPWLGAVTLAAIFSAELGAADAVLSMLSTSFAKDFVKRYVHPNSTAQNLTFTVRLSAVGAGVLSTALAMGIPSVILSLEIFYSLLTSALFVPLIFGVYWRRPDPRAALSSIVTGVTFTVSSRLLTTRESLGVFSPVALGIVAAAITLVLLSMIASQKGSRVQV
jgi:SSS family solute:Na+ symporter